MKDLAIELRRTIKWDGLLLDEAANELDRLHKIEDAARNLIVQKGRYNTQQEYERLAALLVPNAALYVEAEMEQLICKCCGKEARWCGEGENACGTKGCDHIHCDHCGMHYSLELIDGAENPETYERARELMLAAYNDQAQGPRSGPAGAPCCALKDWTSE